MWHEVPHEVWYRIWAPGGRAGRSLNLAKEAARPGIVDFIKKVYKEKLFFRVAAESENLGAQGRRLGARFGTKFGMKRGIKLGSHFWERIF